jgi:hypothetical protein
MTLSGFPDDQAYANWHGLVLENGAITVPGAGTTYGPFAVHNFASVKVLLTFSGGTVIWQMNYYADEAMTQQVGSYQMYATNQTSVSALVPADGPWLEIVASCPGGDAVNLTVSVQPCNVATQRIAYLGYGGCVASGSVSCPANSDLFYFPEWVTPGIAAVYFGPEDTDAELTLELEGQTNMPTGASDLWRLTKPAAEVQAMCLLPDFPVEFKVSNADLTNAHSFRLGVVPSM